MKIWKTWIIGAVLLLMASLACKVPSLGGTPVSYGPCDNILYPFFPAAHWIYQVDKGNGSPVTKVGLTVIRVANSQATIEAADLSSGAVAQTVADCDNGAIRSYPTFSQDMLIGNLVTSDFTLQYVNGVFAPADSVFTANDWNVGWTADYILNGTVQVQYQGQTIPITLKDAPVHLSWQTAGSGDAAFESVTVPAGTFDRALKVAGTMTMEVTFNLAGIPLTGQFTLRFTQWFQPYTGLLKWQIDSGEISAMGIAFPVPVSGSVELVEYLTAH